MQFDARQAKALQAGDHMTVPERTGFALGVLDGGPGLGLLVQVAEVELGAAAVVPAGNAGWFAGLEPEHPAQGRKTTEGTAVNTTAAVAMATEPCAKR